MHTLNRLADFRAGVCKARCDHERSEDSFGIRIRGTEARYDYLFRVVDLPDDGFPTRPISGSRGIVPLKKPLCSPSRAYCGLKDLGGPRTIGM